MASPTPLPLRSPTGPAPLDALGAVHRTRALHAPLRPSLDPGRRRPGVGAVPGGGAPARGPPAFTAALVRYRLDDLGLILRRGWVEVTRRFLHGGDLRRDHARAPLAGRGRALPVTWNFARWVAILPAAVAYPQVRAWVRAGVERALLQEAVQLPRHAPRLRARAERGERSRPPAGATARARDGHPGAGGREGAGARRPRDLRDGGRVAWRSMPSAWPRGPRRAWSPGRFPRFPGCATCSPCASRGACARCSPCPSERRGTPQQRGPVAAVHRWPPTRATAIEAARLLREVRRQAAEVGRLQVAAGADPGEQRRRTPPGRRRRAGSWPGTEPWR